MNRLAHIIIFTGDLARLRRFYEERVGLVVRRASPDAVEFEAAGATLALRTVVDPARRGIQIQFAASDIEDWGMGLMAPSVAGAGDPAWTADPDGNPILFGDAMEDRSLEERLAEPFEDETAPRRGAIRKPVRKGVRATSRVVNRPRYRARKPVTPRVRVTPPAAEVSAPRGTGPAGSRLSPKRRRNSERARTKPAIGRSKKSERQSVKSKKQAVARASKRKPVKRASRVRPLKRTVARRGSGRR